MDFPLTIHIHDNRGQALAAIMAVLLEGWFDIELIRSVGWVVASSSRLLGTSTEDLVFMLEGMGVSTGFSLQRLVDLVGEVQALYDYPLATHIGHYGVPKWLRTRRCRVLEDVLKPILKSRGVAVPVGGYAPPSAAELTRTFPLTSSSSRRSRTGSDRQQRGEIQVVSRRLRWCRCQDGRHRCIPLGRGLRAAFQRVLPRSRLAGRERHADGALLLEWGVRGR